MVGVMVVMLRSRVVVRVGSDLHLASQARSGPDCILGWSHLSSDLLNCVIAAISWCGT